MKMLDGPLLVFGVLGVAVGAGEVFRLRGGSRSAGDPGSWTGEVRAALADTRLAPALLDREDISVEVRNALKVLEFKVRKGPYGSSVFVSSDRAHWDAIDQNTAIVKAWCDAVDAGDASLADRARAAVDAWARRAAFRR